ncbi:hypothetical protein Zmor_019143 [Zophobas morio]|uniref:Uncharacterized protein n=1 Tax=Zophobas morio TaxID=2755281 RepID=A0AA38HIX0_9CUCU|nr:hypothetical protein Zmor_019143 [Zophobas morio]
MVSRTRSLCHLKLLQWNAKGVHCKKDELLQLVAEWRCDCRVVKRDALESGAIGLYFATTQRAALTVFADATVKYLFWSAKIYRTTRLQSQT